MNYWGRILLVIILGCLPLLARAASFGFTVILGDTGPSLPSSMTLQFTAPRDLSGGSRIFTQFDPAFTIPSDFNFEEVDLLVAGRQLPLAAEAGALTSSVQVIDDSVNITLGQAVNIGQNSVVDIYFGAHAQFGTSGTSRIINPSDSGRHGISLGLFSSGGTLLDSQATHVFLLPHIEGTATVTRLPGPAASPMLPGEGLLAKPIIEPVRAIPECERPLDMNGDQRLTVIDFVLLINLWLRAEILQEESGTSINQEELSLISRANFNSDGQVNLRDVSIFLACWDGV